VPGDPEMINSVSGIAASRASAVTSTIASCGGLAPAHERVLDHVLGVRGGAEEPVRQPERPRPVCLERRDGIVHLTANAHEDLAGRTTTGKLILTIR
jgi:hypothetical protein